MRSILGGLLLMGASVALALAGLYGVRRKFPHPIRQANNEVAGFFISVLGVFYAVLLGLVAITVWEQFDGARTDAEKEANEVSAVYRLGLALPDPAGARLRETARAYVVAVIDEDWPAMGRLEGSPLHVQRLHDDLWAIGTSFEPTTERERLLQSQLLTSLHDLNDYRRVREIASQSGLLHIMWVLLIGGAIITVGFTYFFSTPNPGAHYAMTGLYTLSIVFVLVLIMLLDYPFSGDVKVHPEGFELALQTFDRLSRP